MPKVSIITPCYNSEAYVGRTIESVQAQTLTDWEHIVVDDGSTDGSAAIVKKYSRTDSRIKLIRQKNGGVCKARNNGLKHSSPDSEFLYFLDADDILATPMLSTMIGYLEAHNEVGLAYCDYIFVDSQELPLATVTGPRYEPSRFGVHVIPHNEPRTPFVSIYCWAPVMESVSVLRRSVYRQTPGWDEDFGHHGEGVDLFLHFALLSEVHFVPQRLYYYRQHEKQNTANGDKQQAQEKKLVLKWQNLATLTPQQRQIVNAAERFREGRMVPFAGFHAGTAHLRKGEWSQASRFYGGAIRRYAASFL